MKIQCNAVIFDWGNTLVFDPFRHVLENKSPEFLEVLHKRRYPTDKEKLVASWSSANNMSFPHCSHFMQEEKFVCQGLKNMGVKTPHIRELFPRLLEIYRNGVRELVEEDPRNKEVADVLDHLKKKGKRLGMFSNERTGTPQTWLRWVGIREGFFDVILSSEEIGIEKPDPRAFVTMAERLGEKTINCVSVGDNPVKDIQPAMAIGMKTVLLKVPDEYATNQGLREDYHNRLAVPDAAITSLLQLRDLIV